ncbi:MAG TPA: ethanolamine ammonia-lyase reactivating factor EutA [Xanthobacteraceae bacterium]|nr:ethanolamine ammonia-lyase reactivating factor EutA [Xanthobacteraceae bacterium]
MHDLEFEHVHVDDAVETRELREAIWAADNVELTTVGIDIGSSTSHLMFARVHLSRLATGLSSRFVVVERKILWQSPIVLTPYLPDFTIDTAKLAALIAQSYADAGLSRAQVDSGAVILTGEALKRKNSRAIADLFAAEGGKFVCASAGHHMECQLAAHGSGAVKLSASRGKTVLNVDIGGGTTKFALIRNGELLATMALAVGGRLIVEGDAGLVRIEEPALQIARSLGLQLRLGDRLTPLDRERLVSRMAQLIVAGINRAPPDWLAGKLLVTDPWPSHLCDVPLDAITFSGGVAEYIYGREQARFGDLGQDLAHVLRHMLAEKRIAAAVWDPGQGIRATVIGASQFSVQTSGNTILVTDRKLLPLHNLPVLPCRFDLSGEIEPHRVAEGIRAALVRSDMEDGVDTVALAFRWQGEPLHARLAALAKGICIGLPATVAVGLPLVLLIEGDMAQSLGRVLHYEVAPGANVVAIDGVELKQFDYVDIGTVIDASNVVIVIIKSLLFR